MENFLYFLIPLLTGWLLNKKFDNTPRRPHLIVLFRMVISGFEYRFNHGKRRMLKGAIISLTLIAGAFLFALIFLSIARSEIIISGGTRPPSILGMVESNFTSIIPSFCIAESLMGSRVETMSDSIYNNILSFQFWFSITIASFLIFHCFAGNTLTKEVRKVFQACDDSLEKGRKQAAHTIWRDNSTLSEQEVRTVDLETLTKNISGGVIAPLFWYMLLGVPGMLAYKMTNTLDLMIGYQNERYHQFGKVAARIDDVANFIPARLTAIIMILISGTNKRTLTSNDMERAIKNARYTEYLAIIICIVTIYALTLLP